MLSLFGGNALARSFPAAATAACIEAIIPCTSGWRHSEDAVDFGGLLPESLREQYDLPCDRARAALLAASAQALRRAVLPLPPDIVRAVGLERRRSEHR